jgi:hypothetical protein
MLHLFITGDFIVDCFHCAREECTSFDLPNSLESTEVLRYNPSSTLTSSMALSDFHIDKVETSASKTASELTYSGSSVMLPKGNVLGELARRCRGEHPGERGDHADMTKRTRNNWYSVRG